MISAYKTALILSRSIDVVVLTTGSPAVERLNARLTVYRCRDWFLPDPENYSVVPGLFSTLRRVIEREAPTVFYRIDLIGDQLFQFLPPRRRNNIQAITVAANTAE